MVVHLTVEFIILSFNNFCQKQTRSIKVTYSTSVEETVIFLESEQMRISQNLTTLKWRSRLTFQVDVKINLLLQLPGKYTRLLSLH